ncbi:M48 family metalloprotease [Candidatus Microgenomates bacterium]|nr:M48 family metalloprotease [Candidatus Microgenomates bacterium]
MVTQKTWFLIILFVTLVAAAGFVLDRGLAVPFAGLALIVAVCSYFLVGPVALFYYAAKQTTDLRLVEVITNLAMKANIKCPQIYEFKSETPIIFTTGTAKNHASLCLSAGLREKLTRAELEALVARELYHISQNDLGLAIIHTMTSWKREFEADAFAARLTQDPEALISSLEKIGRLNPFHPPINQRVNLLKEM